jgi:hypothetical protein
MNEGVALRVLGTVMQWDDDRAQNEFWWLSLMSRLKYDGYSDFLAGVRFLESLAAWLQQFRHVAEREIAYGFVRKVLLYVGPSEMLRLVELLFPVEVQPRLMRTVARAYGVPTHRVWAQRETAAAYDRAVRRTLFIGLSEGARLDQFRRANSGIVKNDQVLLATYVEPDRFDALLGDLRDEQKDSTARFETIYLIDDFTGSGSSCLRSENGAWKGKLKKFYDTIERKLSTHFSPTLEVCVHHYIASEAARLALAQGESRVRSERGADWFGEVQFSYGLALLEDVAVDRSPLSEARAFADLAKTYFDAEDPVFANNAHLDVGGTRDIPLGFANNGLPLVLEHNTPNNTVTVIWAETAGRSGSDGEAARPPMRPLFRRRQRHS